MSARSVLLAAGAVLGAAALWVALAPRETAHVAPTGRQRVPRATAPPVRAAAPPVSTPGPPQVRSTTVVVPWESAPTPTPTEPEPTEPPTPRSLPSATPAVQECVAIRWSSDTSPASLAQLLVEIHAVNRCGRDLPALDVWFEVAGYRHGDLVQAARGHLFDPLPRDGEGKAMIVLPGSADWYDRVTVAVVPLYGR